MIFGNIILLVSITLLLLSILLLICVFAKHKTLNIHKIWDLALKGETLPKAYYICIGLAFFGAVVSTLTKIGS